MPDLALVDVALGRSPADLVIRGGNLVNVFTEEIYPADVAVYGSKIAAVGDVSGQAGPATRVEISLQREVLVLYRNGQVVLISHVSTGGGYYYCSPGGGCAYAITPVGDFQTQSFIPGWVTVPLGEMYNPVFFIGTAFAIHGDTYVPLAPVSHGCVRIPMDIAAFFHTLVAVPGTPVYIRH